MIFAKVLAQETAFLFFAVFLYLDCNFSKKRITFRDPFRVLYNLRVLVKSLIWIEFTSFSENMHCVAFVSYAIYVLMLSKGFLSVWRFLNHFFGFPLPLLLHWKEKKKCASCDIKIILLRSHLPGLYSVKASVSNLFDKFL